MSKADVVNELHRDARRNYEHRKTIMVSIGDTYQADLIEMIPYAKVNRQFKYILTVIDIFSKFGFAIPLKTKTAKDVSSALREQLFSQGNVPRNLHTDDGGEFFSKITKKLFKEYHINHYSTYSTKKAAICEAFNKTIKRILYKKFSMQGHYKWLQILPEIIKQYNNTIHSTIKMRPKDVKPKHVQTLLQTVYRENQTIGPLKTRLKVGDRVRISRQKAMFEKGYTPNWSTEIFTIYDIRSGPPTTFLLKDYTGQKISGGFYEKEVQKTQYPDVYLVEKVLRRKGDQVLVRWLGMNQQHDSWINKKDII